MHKHTQVNFVAGEGVAALYYRTIGNTQHSRQSATRNTHKPQPGAYKVIDCLTR